MRRPTLEEVYLELTEDERRVRLFLHQLRGEQRLFWRSREAARSSPSSSRSCSSCSLGSVYGDDGSRATHGKASNYLLAGILGYGVATTAFAGLAIMLVIRRECGVLKRLRATPLPAPTYFVAVIVSTRVRLRDPGGRADRARHVALRRELPDATGFRSSSRSCSGRSRSRAWASALPA